MLKIVLGICLLFLTACTENKTISDNKPISPKPGITKNSDIVATPIEIPHDLLVKDVIINITHENYNNGELVAIVKNNSNLTIKNVTLEFIISSHDTKTLTYDKPIKSNNTSKPFFLKNVTDNPKNIQIKNIIIEFHDKKSNKENNVIHTDSQFRKTYKLYRFNNFIIEINDIPLTIDINDKLLKAEFFNGCHYPVLNFEIDLLLDNQKFTLNHDKLVNIHQKSTLFGNIPINIDKLDDLKFEQIRLLAKYNDESDILLNYNFNPASASYEIIRK